VTKKRKKKTKTRKTNPRKKNDKEAVNVETEEHPEEEPLKRTDPKEAERQIQLLIEKGKKKGFLTYEEMNDDLPDDAVSASRLDRLLANLDEMGVKLLDDDDVESHQAAQAQEDGEFEA